MILYKCMKVLLKLGAQENLIKKAYADFSERCLSSNPEINAAKANFKKVRDLFVHENQTEDFYQRTIELSQKLNEQGNRNLGDLLINELSKLCLNLKLPKAEECLKIALENSRRKNDGLHELARLTDLEYLYKDNNNRKALFAILRQKKDCCKKIIEDYNNNVVSYSSIHKAATSKDKVKTQLAFTYSDIAGMLERKKTEDAINLYEKSKNIYIELGQQRESNYLKEKIRRITAKLNKTKE